MQAVVDNAVILFTGGVTMLNNLTDGTTDMVDVLFAGAAGFIILSLVFFFKRAVV